MLMNSVMIFRLVKKPVTPQANRNALSSRYQEMGIMSGSCG
jgi:hypothetical protein